MNFKVRFFRRKLLFHINLLEVSPSELVVALADSFNENCSVSVFTVHQNFWLWNWRSDYHSTAVEFFLIFQRKRCESLTFSSALSIIDLFDFPNTTSVLR